MDYLIYNTADLPAGDPTLLNAAEQAVYARRGENYLRIRCALKQELARRCGITAAEVQLTEGEHGKPLFAPQPFNISHSHGLLCMAFHHGAVGVDIELHRPRPTERLARHFMAEAQWRAFKERGCPQQEFFDCWCAAEALVKHAGKSIWQIKEFPFLYENGRIIPLFEGAPAHITLFRPAAGFSGAVVY